MTVLILAPEFDPTVDAVIQALTERDVGVFRTDLSDFPTRLRVDARLCAGHWSGRLWNDHREVELDELRSIWRRNPSTYTFPASMTTQEQDFAYREAKLGLGGVLAALDVLWVNHPNRSADAVWKPYQWKIAAECGLVVADTCVTNDPDSARVFVGEAPGDTITKALGASGITENGEHKIAYTRRLTNSDLADLRCVAVTATTLQRYVEKAWEVRLTVIGPSWFPIAIHASTDNARTDWRSDLSALSYEVTTVPGDVARGVAQYMHRMNLVFAGLDFVVRPDGQWVLLEANTGPQIGWLEAATGAPMVAAMADLLLKGACDQRCDR